MPSGKSVIIQYWHWHGASSILPASSPVTKSWATIKFLNIWMILPSTPSFHFQGFQVMLSRHLGCGGGALASTSRTWLLSLRRHRQGGPATSGLGCGDVLLLSFSDWTPRCLVTGHPKPGGLLRACVIALLKPISQWHSTPYNNYVHADSEHLNKSLQKNKLASRSIYSVSTPT